LAFVPGFRHDLFLSYAHLDDTARVEGFEKSLRQGLRERLGQDIEFWQDTLRLRLGNNWREEIERAIEETAALVAVVSPAYLSSPWCRRERSYFLEQFRSNRQMLAGGVSRFLKIIKTPAASGAHMHLLPELQHIAFLEPGNGDGPEMEFLPGSEEFRSKVQDAAHAIATLLRALRRTRQPVYIAFADYLDGTG
jgi:hypothetical protein